MVVCDKNGIASYDEVMSLRIRHKMSKRLRYVEWEIW